MGIDGQKKTVSARGEQVDFDLLLIKQQLAAAPQNIEVTRRKEFIDNKEQRSKKRTQPIIPEVTIEENQPLQNQQNKISEIDFENENGDVVTFDKKEIEPIPIIDRKNKNNK